jgi:ribonuclease P protein component
MALLTLRKRSEFLRVRGGRRWSTPAFLLEAKPRPSVAPLVDGPTVDEVSPTGQPRFGFTVTKKMGNAVIRNRIRRRLRAAVTELAPACADPTYDYVVLARKPALDRPFADLRDDMRTAFERIHRAASGAQPKKGRRDGIRSGRALAKSAQGSKP